MYIEKVSDQKQIDIVATLACKIWHEYFTPIIGKAQVEYMLEKFQSTKSIEQQIKNGFIYFLLINNAEPIGYAGIFIKDSELFLSKLYVVLAERNKGFGKQVIVFLEDLALEQGAKKITLTVNKNNSNTIDAYQKMGFINVESVIKNIGENFVMDDYIMEKNLHRPFSNK